MRKIALLSALAAAFAAAACSDRAPTSPDVSSSASSPANARVDSMVVRNSARRPAPRTLSMRSSSTPTMLQGIWGGKQVNLILRADGGSFKTFCSDGEIDQVVAADGSGHFDVAGSVAIQMGPTRRYPARYSGSTAGHTMTLTISVPDAQKTLGPFTLTYGQKTDVSSCPIL